MSLKSRSIQAGATLWFAAALTCCTTAGHSDAAPKEQLIAVGWVQAAGEIRIYAHSSDLGKLYDRSCISGLMTEGRTLPPEFQNRRMTVYGTLVDAKEIDKFALHAISVGVENYCNSPKIAIITRLVVADPLDK